MTLARTLTGIVAAILLALSGMSGDLAARPKSPGQATAPAPKAMLKAGTLLKYDRIKLPALYRASAWRITYVTRDYRMRPTLSTGIVVLPDKAPRVPMERRFVAWAHPTTGIARKCAPSLRASPIKAIAGLNDLVAAGVVVAATDYPGLGTDGPMGYLVGRGQAFATIDSVRAAKQIPGVGGSNDYALWGYSQGGHAALFAAELSRGYAPELKLKGVAAIAPPTDLPALLRANVTTVAGRILASFTLSSWNVKYGASLRTLVDTRGAAVVSEVGRSCVDDLGGKLDALAAQKGLEKQFLKADPARLKPWSDLLVQNSLYGMGSRVPALVMQGDVDDIVRPQVTAQFVRSSCRSGINMEYVVLKGKGHGSSLGAGSKQAVAWLSARLRGVPARNNCR
ncbi:alpha/beta fold hydrolase [Aestuariivirga sp.]|uniref:alpha/beta fold hydrolase n=1 Tax=Aestuariivirga sp. TaxID=2650926 RepID=UPI00359470D2